MFGVPCGFYPDDEFWTSLVTHEYPPNLKEVVFRFLKDVYLLPRCILDIVELLPYKLSVIEVTGCSELDH